MPKGRCKRAKAGRRSYREIHIKKPKKKHKKKATSAVGGAVSGPS